VTEQARQEWLERRERGATSLIRLFVWVALHLGRSIARLLLYPICGYFLLFSAGSRAASRGYLARVLDRAPRLVDLFRHYHAFGSCVLDRVFLLNDQTDRFRFAVHGEEIVNEIIAQREGCLLLGAHLGSFEVVRALGRRRTDVAVSLLMYEENARKIGTALNAINPALGLEIIALGKSNSMIEVEARLDRAHFVGVLADRSLKSESCPRLPFLGAPAAFPLGPFRMAVLLDRPVVLMLGLYRGGNRYEIHFERLDAPGACGAGRPAEEMMRRYAARLEHYCRMAPYNWFNFYDFWR
jgi:predicted LPLAT superfamily acyltransferase